MDGFVISDAVTVVGDDRSNPPPVYRPRNLLSRLARRGLAHERCVVGLLETYRAREDFIFQSGALGALHETNS